MFKDLTEPLIMKSLLFKEMVEDSDKESVKEALTKCLESL